MKGVKIRFLAADLQGSGFYRAQLPVKYLKELGYDAELTRDRSKIDKDTKVLIFQRAWYDEDFQFIMSMKGGGTRVLYEIDDNVWGIPDHIAASRILDPGKAERCMKACDAVIVSTNQLKKVVKERVSSVHVVPNFVEYQPFSDRNNYQIKIGFCGSSSHYLHMRHLAPALTRINSEFPKVDLWTMGVTCRELQMMATKVDKVDSDKYLSSLANLELDIGIAFVFDDPFNRCRSPLKFFEYSMAGTMTMAQNRLPYSDVITDGETGVLVDDDNNWYECIKAAIRRTDRRRIAKNAHQYVSDKWLMKDNIKQWVEILNGYSK